MRQDAYSWKGGEGKRRIQNFARKRFKPPFGEFVMQTGQPPAQEKRSSKFVGDSQGTVFFAKKKKKKREGRFIAKRKESAKTLNNTTEERSWVGCALV